MYLFFLARCFFSLVLSQSPPPVASHQQLEELKELLARRVVEVEVVPAVPEGADPAGAQPVIGQGVCLRDSHGTLRPVTSAFLISGAESIRIRAKRPEKKPSPSSWRTASDWNRGQPEPKEEARWARARIAELKKNPEIAFLAPEENGGFVCPETTLAPPEQARPNALVYSIDDPLGSTAIFWGLMDRRGEPPLANYLLTSSGLPLGGPLFSVSGELVAFNLRRYAPGSRYSLSATALQLHRVLHVERDTKHAEKRFQRRGLHQSDNMLE